MVGFVGVGGGGCGMVFCVFMNSSQQYLICVDEYLAEKGMSGAVSLCGGAVGMSGGGDWRCVGIRFARSRSLSSYSLSRSISHRCFRYLRSLCFLSSTSSEAAASHFRLRPCCSSS